ncbi:Uncharacterized protein FKW44_001920 [Caligus rogercresseyi]|uniref:Thioredoxin domain-containing protein n=1 Tax=Caligus rogercresseyi TaxID=217165 RepID=A0A7T8KJN8_CALRO|nr:Uncharacterized protein FKW44_001920 [Caligus rogercresseyi]
MDFTLSKDVEGCASELSCLLSLSRGDNDDDLMNKESFEAAKAEGALFVKFFAPWCSHCKRLAPTWSSLADKYAEKDVQIARVDCTIETEFCSRSTKYRGQRDLDSLVKFIETQMGRIEPEKVVPGRGVVWDDIILIHFYEEGESRKIE